MTMNAKRHTTLNLFYSIAIVFLFVFLFSFPGLAGTSTESPPLTLGTYTPTIFPVLTQPDNIITSSPTPIALGTQPNVITDTQTSTPTQTPSPTDMSSLTSTPSPAYTSSPTYTPSATYTSPLPEISTVYSPQFSFFPYLVRDLFIPTFTPTPTPPPPETVLFCDHLTQPLSVPDNDMNGVNNDLSITDERLLVSVNLYLDISHSWVGDLVVKLTHQNTGETITALDRPGSPPLG